MSEPPVTNLTGTKPIVFVTQVPHRRDKETGALSPSVNIGPAGEYGDFEIIMPSNASFYAASDLVQQLRARLKHYHFDRGDSLLALGDPAILATAAALVGQYSSRFRVLKWDKRAGRYLSVEIAL